MGTICNCLLSFVLALLKFMMLHFSTKLPSLIMPFILLIYYDFENAKESLLFQSIM